MSLLDTIKADYLAARKQKNTAVIAALSTFLGDLETNSKKTGKPIDDAQIVALAKARISTMKEVLTTLNNTTIPAAVATIEAEIPMYEKYLPVQLTEAQIWMVIVDLKNDIGENPLGFTLGVVQAYFKSKFPGQYNGKLVSETFKTLQNG